MVSVFFSSSLPIDKKNGGWLHEAAAVFERERPGPVDFILTRLSADQVRGFGTLSRKRERGNDAYFFSTFHMKTTGEMMMPSIFLRKAVGITNWPVGT
jgi:hypothetical protein